MMTRVVFLAALATSFVACGLPDPSDDVISADDLDGKTDDVSSAKSALPAGAAHLYFGSPAAAYLSADQPLSYLWFTANAGAGFKVGAAEVDENNTPIPTEHVGFKLQRAVSSHGKWSWSVVAQADSDSGAAVLTYAPKTGPGLYLVTSTGSPLPAQLTVSVTCGGFGCETAREPNESCGGIAGSHFQCDAGLFCDYTLAQQCGAGGQLGVCAVKSSVCPLFYRPECGCDGVTYGNTCQAASHGTSIQRVGTCAANVVGNWEFIAKSGGSHYDYTFNADGTFVSTEQPGCAFTTPRCLIKIAPASGNYAVSATDLSLTYSSDFRSGQTADFSIQKAGTHLVGSDWGASLDLTRK